MRGLEGVFPSNEKRSHLHGWTIHASTLHQSGTHPRGGYHLMKCTIYVILFILILAGSASSEPYTIGQCIEMPRQKNLNLKKQESELRIAMMRANQARGNFYPKISSEAEFTNRSYTQSFSPPYAVEYHPYYFLLEQPIYHFGEFTNKLRETEALRFGALLNLLEENIQIEKNVIFAYLNVLKQKKLMAHSRNSIMWAEKQLKIVEAMVSKGQHDASGIKRWQVLIDSYRDDLTKQENSLADSYIELKRLMELNIADEDIHVAPFEIVENYEYDHNQIERMAKEFTKAERENILYRYAETYSPAVKRRDFDVTAARCGLSYEISTNWPKIDFAPRFVRDDYTDATYWQLGIRLRANILSLPNWEAIFIRREQLNQVEIDKGIFVRDRKSQISTVSARFNAAIQKLTIAIGQVEAAAQYVIHKQKDYDKGTMTDIELVDAFNQFYSSNNSRIQALYDFFAARQELYALIGHSYSLQSPSVDEFIKTRDIHLIYSEKDLLYDYFFMKDIRNALERDDGKKARQLLDKYRSLIGENAFMKWSTLHFAAYYNCMKAAEQRLKAGVKVDSETVNGVTPLYIASEQGYKELVELFIKSGANVNVKAEEMSWTPLMKVAKRNYLDIAGILIQAGARVNEQSSFGRTALHNAAEEGYLPMVELLFKSGADIHIRNNDGKTALDLARREGYFQVVEYLETLNK
jgi:outer membrane protein TolC